jgi:hypothetical protein
MKLQFQGIKFDIKYPVNKTGLKITTDYFYSSKEIESHIEGKLINYLFKEGFFPDFFKTVPVDVILKPIIIS